MLSTFPTFTLPSYIPSTEIHQTPKNPNPQTVNTDMAINKNWLTTIRLKFSKSPHKTTILVHVNPSETTPREEEEENKPALEDGDEFTDDHDDSSQKWLTENELAAIKIQAAFRGHLARQAFRALRGLVKLQALVRGVCARRQARIALYCMQALVRLQVGVRARQLLDRSGVSPS